MAEGINQIDSRNRNISQGFKCSNTLSHRFNLRLIVVSSTGNTGNFSTGLIAGNFFKAVITGKFGAGSGNTLNVVVFIVLIFD
jgi:hypothetical protein